MKKLFALLKKFKIYLVNSAWVFTGLVIRTLIAIFIVSKIAAIIGPIEFGWYNLCISVFTILFAISALGLNPSFIIKHLVNDTHSNETVIGTSLITRALFSLFILVIMLLWIYFTKQEFYYYAVLIASSSILFQISEVYIAYYQWKLKANIYVGITIVSLLIVSVLYLIGIYNNWGLFYYVAIYALERLIILIGLSIYFNFKSIPLSKLTFKWSLFMKLFSESWPLLCGALLTALYARFDQFLIKHFLSVKAIGIYGAGVILTQVWYTVPSLIIPILFPKIAELKKEERLDEYKSLISGLYAILNYLAIFIILGTLIFGKYIIEFLYGSEYSDSAAILSILICSLIVLYQSHLTSSVMVIENNERYLFVVKSVGVAVNIILNIIFLKVYGVKFAAYAILISAVVSWFLMALFNSTMRMLLKLWVKSFIVPLKINKLLQ